MPPNFISLKVGICWIVGPCGRNYGLQAITTCDSATKCHLAPSHYTYKYLHLASY